MDIVDQIRIARKAKGVTQVELARRTGLKQAALARIESHRMSPTVNMLTRILDALDLELTLKDSFYYPNHFNKYLKGLNHQQIKCGQKNNKVFIFEDKYILKSSSDIESIRNEKMKDEWFFKHGYGPKPIEYIEENGVIYYLRTCLKGHTLIEDQYLLNPVRLISILKKAIGVLKELNQYECPFDSLDNEGTDLIHGDLCLPNIIVNDNDDIVGFIDLSNSGKGDKDYDCCWLLWSFEYNLKTNTYSQQLLDSLGITIDNKKYLFYVLANVVNNTKNG